MNLPPLLTSQCVTKRKSVLNLPSLRLRINNKPNFQTKKIVLLLCLMKPDVHQTIQFALQNHMRLSFSCKLRAHDVHFHGTNAFCNNLEHFLLKAKDNKWKERLANSYRDCRYSTKQFRNVFSRGCCHLWSERTQWRSEQFDQGNRHRGIGWRNLLL